jgi:hypothetical protein
MIQGKEKRADEGDEKWATLGSRGSNGIFREITEQGEKEGHLLSQRAIAGDAAGEAGLRIDFEGRGDERRCGVIADMNGGDGLGIWVHEGGEGLDGGVRWGEGEEGGEDEAGGAAEVQLLKSANSAGEADGGERAD